MEILSSPTGTLARGLQIFVVNVVRLRCALEGLGKLLLSGSDGRSRVLGEHEVRCLSSVAPLSQNMSGTPSRMSCQPGVKPGAQTSMPLLLNSSTKSFVGRAQPVCWARLAGTAILAPHLLLLLDVAVESFQS